MELFRQCIFFILSVAFPTLAEHSRQKRVIGGQPVEANSVPWIVNFKVHSNQPQQCSGNLINSEWIITAAHCFNTYSLTDFTLVAGDHYIDERDRYEKILQADQEFIHPSFLPAPSHDRSPGDFDIALIHLSSKVNFTNQVRPIRLPNATTSFPEGHLCKISGWGNVVKESKYKRSVVLRQTEVKLVSREACNSNESYDGVIPESFLCAGYKEGGRDACYGDSGGPLQCKNADDDWVLIGIVAWGKGCANPNKYGVYTDIKKIMPFALSIISDEKRAEASKIVKKSIWRSSKVFNTSIEKMAREVHTTPDKLLQIPLKDTFSTLLSIEKKLIIKRMVSRLAISASVMDKCFLANEARVFTGKIDINDFKSEQNILANLRNHKCFLRFASLEMLEKLSKISLGSLYNLDLISVAKNFFKDMEFEEILLNLDLFSEQVASLKKYDVSEISRLLIKHKKPALRNLTISEAAMHVLSITNDAKCSEKRNQCSRNANCIELVGFYRCQCQKGFVGNGRNCRTGPAIFNITYKRKGKEFTDDLSNPSSFKYLDRSDGVQIFFQSVYVYSSLSDVFIGTAVQAFRNDTMLVEETLQVFDYDKDGHLPSHEDILRILEPHIDIITVQATNLCKLSAHNCSAMSSCRPYPGGFYCDPSTSDTASDAHYKIMTIVLGLVSLCLFVTVASLFMYMMSRKKTGSYQEVPLNGIMSQKKTVPDYAHV